MSVSLVSATPFMGLIVILNFFGAVKPSLARQSTQTGYHWSTAGLNFVSAHSFNSGDRDTSSVQSKSFTRALMSGPGRRFRLGRRHRPDINLAEKGLAEGVVRLPS